MAKVFEVAIERARSAQPKEYESSSARVSVKAVVEDGEDWRAVTAELLDGARTEVFNTLGLKLPAKSGQETVTETATTEDKSSKSTAKSGSKGKAKPAEKPANDVPDDKPAETGKSDDIPDDETKPAESEASGSSEETESVSADELGELITDAVQSHGVKVPDIKKILSEFNLERARDAKDEDRPEIKKKVEALYKK